MSEPATEIVFVKDKDWRAIDAEPCRVKVFTPLATLDGDGLVRALSWSMPYAAIHFECALLPQEATGYITHKLDFRHLWTAFNERGVAESEEVIVFWTRKMLRPSARLVARIMPRLWVMVCPAGAYELMTNPEARPELSGLARWEAEGPLADWKPEVML